MAKKITTIEEVARAAEAAINTTPGRERRRFRRVPIKGVLHAELHTTRSPSHRVELKDLSRGGIGFYSDLPLQSEEEIELIAILADNENVKMLCRVRRCDHEKTKDRYIVGAEVVNVLRCGGAATSAEEIFESPAKTGDADKEHVNQVSARLEEFLATQGAQSMIQIIVAGEANET